MPANLENSAVATVFIPIQIKAMPKNTQTTAQLHSSHTSKVMLIILQARLQQYVNHELSDVQAGFRKVRETRDEIGKHSLGHGESKEILEKHLLLH